MANNLIQGTTNISDISKIDIELTSEDEVNEDEILDEINSPYDSDDGIYRDEEDRAQAEYSYYERMWERIVTEN